MVMDPLECGCRGLIEITRFGDDQERYHVAYPCERHTDPAVLARRLAVAELDDIDRATGLADVAGWRPLGRIPVPGMEAIRL